MFYHITKEEFSHSLSNQINNNNVIWTQIQYTNKN